MSRVACLMTLVSLASAQLTLDGVRCGGLTCQLEEYCSPDTNRCAPCNVVCDKRNHNYDSGLCIKECQGYLLDLRYMRRSETSTPPDSVQLQARAALIVSVVALAVLLIVLMIVCKGRFTWKYIKQKFQPAKNRVKQYPGDLTHHNPHAEMPIPKQEIKLEIRNPNPSRHQNMQPLNPRDLDTKTSQTEKSHGPTTPKTISTALSNRHPAEDTTLDFAYDNVGLNVTPPAHHQTERF